MEGGGWRVDQHTPRRVVRCRQCRHFKPRCLRRGFVTMRCVYDALGHCMSITQPQLTRHRIYSITFILSLASLSSRSSSRPVYNSERYATLGCEGGLVKWKVANLGTPPCCCSRVAGSVGPYPLRRMSVVDSLCPLSELDRPRSEPSHGRSVLIEPFLEPVS